MYSNAPSSVWIWARTLRRLQPSLPMRSQSPPPPTKAPLMRSPFARPPSHREEDPGPVRTVPDHQRCGERGVVGELVYEIHGHSLWSAGEVAGRSTVYRESFGGRGTGDGARGPDGTMVEFARATLKPNGNAVTASVSRSSTAPLVQMCRAVRAMPSGREARVTRFVIEPVDGIDDDELAGAATEPAGVPMQRRPPVRRRPAGQVRTEAHLARRGCCSGSCRFRRRKANHTSRSRTADLGPTRELVGVGQVHPGAGGHVQLRNRGVGTDALDAPRSRSPKPGRRARQRRGRTPGSRSWSRCCRWGRCG